MTISLNEIYLVRYRVSNLQDVVSRYDFIFMERFRDSIHLLIHIYTII